MALLDTNSLQKPELREFADQYFARLGAQGYAVFGRGVIFVRIDAVKGSARPQYRPLGELVGDDPVISGAREFVTRYDPAREAVLVYLDAETLRVLAAQVVTIEAVS